MIKAIVIEDENLARSLLEDYITEVPFMQCIGSYANPLLALEQLHQQAVDVLFLDIRMPKLSGLEFLSQLPNHPFVVFTTAFAEHALQGYEFNTVDYLVKPISFERFFKACLKVRKLCDAVPEMAPEKAPMISIPDGGRTLHFRPNELYFAESNGDYLELHTATGSKHIRMSLKRLLALDLPLLRIHKSFAVNPDFIQVRESRSVVVKGTEIPIGRSFRKVLTNEGS